MTVSLFTRRVSDIDLRLLRVFTAVAEAGGFAASEVELNISRSTISTHIADLESRLGMTLCNRSRGRSDFSLTPQGIDVYKATKDLFDQLNDYSSALTAIRTKMGGSLRVALPDDWLEMSDACFDLSRVIAKFRERAPNVDLSIVTKAPNEVDFELLNGSADLGITTVHAARPGLEYLSIFSHTSHLYCSANHPLYPIADGDISLESLARHALASFGYRLQPETQALTEMFPKRAYADHMEGCLLLLLSGAYLGFLPDYYAQAKQERYPLRRVKPEQMTYRVRNAVAYRKNSKDNPVVAEFMRELRKAIRE